MFQPIDRYLERIIGVGSGEYIHFRKSKGLSAERINCKTTSNYSIIPELNYCGKRMRVRFDGSCLIQNKITYTHGKTVNIYTVYEILGVIKHWKIVYLVQLN